MHMAATRPGSQSGMVRTGWANSCPGCMDMTCTWWLLGLAVKMPWLGPGGTSLALAAWTGLENAIILSPCVGSQGDMYMVASRLGF